MIIRTEQITVFEDKAEEDFVQRLAAHLRENYPESLVRQAETDDLVKDLSDEVLFELVRVSIQRARKYDLTYESSISAFTALMFSTAPNFDMYNLSNLCLKDENVEPNDRLDEILKIFNEGHWEKVILNYDVTAWEPLDEEAEKEAERLEAMKNADNPQDFVDTNVGTKKISQPRKPKTSAPPDLDETFYTPAKIGESIDSTRGKDINLDETIPNFDINKE
jgi:hypothetical protein